MGLGISANLINENPSGSSVPASSTVEGGMVGSGVGVSVTGIAVGVSVGGGDVEVEVSLGKAAVGVGGTTVAVPG